MDRGKWGGRDGGMCGRAGKCVRCDSYSSELTDFVLPFSSEKFEARDVRWAPDGKGLLLLDRETFCSAFEAEE